MTRRVFLHPRFLPFLECHARTLRADQKRLQNLNPEQDTRAKRTKNTGTLVCGRLPQDGFWVLGRGVAIHSTNREFTEGISMLGSPQLPAVRTCRRFCCRRSHRLLALQPSFKHHELSLGERHELPLEPRRWLWGPGLPIAAFGRRSVGSCRWAAWQGEPAPVRQHDGT